jgi:hypothetical protein
VSADPQVLGAMAVEAGVVRHQIVLAARAAQNVSPQHLRSALLMRRGFQSVVPQSYLDHAKGDLLHHLELNPCFEGGGRWYR